MLQKSMRPFTHTHKFMAAAVAAMISARFNLRANVETVAEYRRYDVVLTTDPGSLSDAIVRYAKAVQALVEI